MSILETEKRKEERGKLGCILIDRLIKKFGRYPFMFVYTVSN